MILFYFRGRAEPDFGAGGRQKSSISPDFCLLPGPRTPILDQPVDKNQTFLQFLSTFEAARADFGGGGRTYFQAFMADFVSTFEVRADLDFGGGGRQNSNILPEFLFYFRGRADPNFGGGW